jgi:cysteine-rich repeat protein
MRTSAFIVVLAASIVAGCGDSTNSLARPDLCSNGAAADGDSCGTGMICRSSQCVASKCGDGIVAAGEECDDGNMVDGDGCDSSCKFTCLSSDATRSCAPADACAGKGVCSDAHVCVTGKPLADGQSCGVGGSNVCSAGVCTSPLCGNGVLDFGEECDDGGKLNLDGCDSACKVEQAARITALKQQFETEEFCPNNVLGKAITFAAQDIIQVTWDQPVADGRISIVFKFLGGIDPFGASSTFKLGFVSSVPVRFNKQDDGNGNISFADGYTGVSDIDWWYARNPASVDATETPLVQLPGQVTNRHLTAGPGTLTDLDILFALQPTKVTLFHAKVDATIDIGVSHPVVSTAGAAPGHLASEHASPNLFEFLSSSTGALCSDVSVASLANTPIGELLQGSCTRDPDANDHEFTPDNHLLDVFITGCDIFGTPGITPTQPDGSLNGATYAFQFDPATRAVTGCTKDGQPADLTNDCLVNATYSSFFKFSSDRVIIKRAPQPPF